MDYNSTLMVCGIQSCKEFLRSKFSKEGVILRIQDTKLQDPIVQIILKQAREENIRIQNVPSSYFRKMIALNPQGICIQMATDFSFMEESDLEKNIENIEATKPQCFLLLEGITDVRNFGSLIRSAEVMGVQGIIIGSNYSAPVNEGTIRASCGAVFHLPLYKVFHIKDAIFLLQSLNFKIYACSEKATANSLNQNFPNRCAFVLGSEEKGLSLSTLKACDETLAIPIKGQTASLNVAVTGAIMVHEFIRQQYSNTIIT